MTSPHTPHADTVDLGDVVRTVRRRWRLVAGFTVAGALAALAIVLVAPRRFQGSSSVVVRAESGTAGSILSQLSGGAGGAIGGLLGGGARSPLETELQILQSGALVGRVVDSLGLQVRVREPAGVPTSALVAAVDLPGSFKPAKYEFVRSSDGSYVADVDGRPVAGRPGGVTPLPVGRVTIRDTALPPRFVLQLFDRDDAVQRAQQALGVGKAGGEVVKITYRAPDSVTAAAVPNALVVSYLDRRKTTDRGSTVRRVEFLESQVDSVASQLAVAETALRRHQEASGVIDAPIVGKLQLEQAGALRATIGAAQVEEGALTQLLQQVRSGTVTARQLAAYPSFLKSPGINDLLRQLSELETQRTLLLERRREADPEVVAVTQSIRDLEGQLLPIATSYAASLRTQRSDMSRQLDTLQAALAAFPAAAQSTVRLQRDVLRLSQIHGALQAQMVEARLAAISEGGDVRQLDAATPPKRVVFPDPVFTMGFGLGGGLVLGLIATLLTGTLGRYMDDPRLIERATGAPALQLGAGMPLLVGSRVQPSTVLVAPLDDAVSTAAVAERLARTALARSVTTTILDLSDAATLPFDGVPAAIARLEAEHGLVIVRLPGLGTDVSAAAMQHGRPTFLVAGSARVDRDRLLGAVDLLRRADVPVAGVVLDDAVLVRDRRRLTV